VAFVVGFPGTSLAPTRGQLRGFGELVPYLLRSLNSPTAKPSLLGILFAAIEVTSGLGSLFAGRVMRLGDPQRTMLTGTVLSILLISVTPFIGTVFTLLLLAQAMRGWLQGSSNRSCSRSKPRPSEATGKVRSSGCAKR
jgi:hypothetical protein